MRPAKRIFDVLISLSGIVVFSPLLFAVSLLILLSEGWPVLFIQERVGYQGRRFHIWKFRTMVTNAESLGGTLTVGDDSRVTAVGRMLRKYKLDEMPQLFNVLKGEMSLVGPRPEVPRYVARYSRDQRVVLDLYPGITDPASITYRDESRLLAESADPERTYIESVMPDKISININYAAKANLWSDFLVLIKTVVEVFAKGGSSGAAE